MGEMGQNKMIHEDWNTNIQGIPTSVANTSSTLDLNMQLCIHPGTTIEAPFTINSHHVVILEEACKKLPLFYDAAFVRGEIPFYFVAELPPMVIVPLPKLFTIFCGGFGHLGTSAPLLV
ncbi:hypothetical protein VNO77_44146 [Canavalia gladiata]|uniref:Uncharacterized protein n=1 Tax=Canavalia gladiata TaxID=3824 RepID=A0AAN9JVH9_CANGL